jgi:hypothetical protein
VPAPVTAATGSGAAKTRINRRPPRPVVRPGRVPQYQRNASGKSR